MLFKNRCYNGGDRHKFTGRYNKQFPKGGLKAKGFFSADDYKERIYIYDICEWCGKKIKSGD